MGSPRGEASLSCGTDVIPKETQNFWNKFTGLADTNSVYLENKDDVLIFKRTIFESIFLRRN